MTTRLDDEGVATMPPLQPQRFLGLAIFIGSASWIAAFVAMNTVLIPARLELVAPDQKVALVATLTAIGAVVSLLATIAFGAFSDLTRSRLGRRTPWILAGAIGTFASTLFIMNVTSGSAMVVGWALFQFCLAAIVAPMVTIIPDRVTEERRGSYSSIYGVSMMVGGAIGGIVASRFIADPQQGMLVIGIVVLLGGPIFVLLAPDASNLKQPREAFSGRMLIHNFSIPLKNSRDFYFALVGKLLFVIGTFSITGYQLYILTDYIGASAEQAGNTIALMSMINLVLGALFAGVSGVISDRFRRRKIFVVAAAGILVVGTLFPFLIAEPWAMLVFAAFSGVGGGVFNAVDQAVNYDVLPDPETAAKDLGILNMANTGGQALGPAIASGAVALTATFGSVFVVSAISLGLSGLAIKMIRKSS